MSGLGFSTRLRGFQAVMHEAPLHFLSHRSFKVTLTECRFFVYLCSLHGGEP